MDKLNEKNNFMYLTAALVGLLLTLPFMQLLPDGPSNWIVRGLVVILLLITHHAVDFGPWWGRFIGALLVLLVISTLFREVTGIGSTGLLHLVLLLLFFGSLTYSCAHRVLFRGGHIDSNKIFGGIAIYLLLGLVWSMLYLIVLELIPESIHGIAFNSWEDSFYQVTYFSYVTLTTLGYGDISPTHPITQALAYLEAISGTFYMAIVVASLIGARTHPTPK